MGKLRAPRLLRACFCLSGRNRSKEAIGADLEEGERDPDGGGVPATLPDDIIFDVLSRLPVKPLCRFRCVSKAWRALISDPAFAAAQSSRGAAAAPLVVGVFGGKPWPFGKFYPSVAPRTPEKSLDLRVIDTADGSVLKVIKDVKSAKVARTRLGLVFVDQGVHGAMAIDPATGRVVTVGGEAVQEYPKADLNGVPYDGLLYGCLCHSTLGRATPSGVYKVVRLRDIFTVHGKSQICQIATLGAAAAAEEVTWRRRPDPPLLTCHCSGCTATVNGVLYFLDIRAPAHGVLPRSPGWNRLASFDLESEEWKTMINGPPIECQRGEMALAELKGMLSLVQVVGSFHRNTREPYVNIWLLVDSERSTWVKQYKIQVPRGCCLFKVLEIMDDGRILILNASKEKEQNLYDIQCVLQLHHPSTGVITNLVELGNDFRGPTMTLYTGSLLS
ncbi:hypothetical protein ACP70R_026925 [Stipagrostis hirtigluma subsp. patula]